jgi:hypothetical protein
MLARLLCCTKLAGAGAYTGLHGFLVGIHVFWPSDALHGLTLTFTVYNTGRSPAFHTGASGG